MSATFELRIEHHGAVPVARVSGEIDIASATRLRDALLSEVSNQGSGLVVDLTDVGYLDSAGVNTLFEVAERLALGQLRLAVVVPEGNLVERVLTIVDMASVADLRRTLESAVAAVADADADGQASSTG